MNRNLRPVTALVLGLLLTLTSLASAAVTAQSASATQATPYITIQNISKGTIGETDFGAKTATFTVHFKCHGAPVGTFLQVETAVTQGSNEAFGFAGSRCTGTSQKMTVTNISDVFYPDIVFVPGEATGRATVYGCPTGEDEFCGGFITEKTTRIMLR